MPREPVSHTRPQSSPGGATHDDSDVASLQHDLLRGGAACRAHDRAGGGSRGDLVARSSNVEQRTADVLQLHGSTINAQASADEFVVLVELRDPLAVSGAGKW